MSSNYIEGALSEALSKHDYGGAIEHLKKMNLNDPLSWKNFLKLGSLYYETRDFSSVVKLFQGLEGNLESNYALVFAISKHMDQYGSNSEFLNNTKLFFDEVPGDLTVTEPLRLHRASCLDNTAVLTIDDGPSEDVTPLILNALRRKNVRASFFLVGSSAEKYPHLVDKIVDHGHEIYSHGYDHTPFPHLTQDEIIDQLDRTEFILNKHRERPKNKIIRLPGGQGWNSQFVHDSIKTWSIDTLISMWNVDPQDYNFHLSTRYSGNVELEVKLRVWRILFDKNVSKSVILTHDRLANLRRVELQFYPSFYRKLIDSIISKNISLIGLSESIN